MSLTLFTTEDTQRLINVFNLPYSWLENTDNILYVGMLETEERQKRLNIDFVNQIRDLLSDIEILQDSIVASQKTGEPTNIKSVEIVGEVKTEFGQNKDGSYGDGFNSIKTLINQYKIKIQQILDIYRRKGMNKIC